MQNYIQTKDVTNIIRFIIICICIAKLWLLFSTSVIHLVYLFLHAIVVGKFWKVYANILIITTKTTSWIFHSCCHAGFAICHMFNTFSSQPSCSKLLVNCIYHEAKGRVNFDTKIVFSHLSIFISSKIDFKERFIQENLPTQVRRLTLVRSRHNGIIRLAKTNRLYENWFILPRWDLTST